MTLNLLFCVAKIVRPYFYIYTSHLPPLNFFSEHRHMENQITNNPKQNGKMRDIGDREIAKQRETHLNASYTLTRTETSKLSRRK